MGRKQKLRQERKIQHVQEQEAIKNKNIKQRGFLKKLGSIALAAIISYTSIKYFNDYQNTKKSESLSETRQKYLENLVSSNEIPFSSGIIYDADGSKMMDYYKKLISCIETNPIERELALEKVRTSIKDPNTPVKTPEIFDLSSQEIKPPIYVNKIFFDNDQVCKTAEDKAHVLKYHEGRHAEQVCKGLKQLGYLDKEEILEGLNQGKIIYEVLYGLGEIDALNNELSAIGSGKSKVSDSYLSKTINEYRMARKIFQKAIPLSSPIQKKLIEKILDKNPAR